MSEEFSRFTDQLAKEWGRPTPVTVDGGRPASLWAVTGVEIVVSQAQFPERGLRRIWGEREGKRGVPVLLVAPHTSPTKAWVVGPSEAAGPAVAVEIDALFHELQGLHGLSERRAASLLAEAIARLEQVSIPGVLVHGLLTNHFVEHRLPASRPKLQPAGTAVAAASGWRARLTAAGYTVTQSGRGYVLREKSSTVAVLHAYADAAQFGRVAETGALPEGILIRQCQETGAAWGILAAGDRFRLFYAETERGAATDRWLELDASMLSSEWTFLLGLLSPVALRQGGLMRQFLQDASDFGVRLRETIEEQIREVTLPAVARGIGDWLLKNEGSDLSKPDVREEIQRATLTFLFRLLFLLYAESKGFLPIHSTAYRPHAATTLAHEAKEIDGSADPSSSMFWDRVRMLVHALRTGNRAWGVHAYNGSLFAADDLPGASLLERASVTDTYMVPALEALGFDGNVREQDAGIDYASLEIGHLGAIYEGLLSLRLSLATETLGWDERNERYVPKEEPGDRGVAEGTLFFQTETGGRKAGGVYYTRQDIVRNLVTLSVLPALEEHLVKVQATAGRDPEGAAKLLFGFRVLDPAMGSAHFLVDALDVIADRMETFLAAVPIPAIRDALDQLRIHAGEASTAAEDGQLLRRLVLKHCIYGVDLSEMAVEIGRVSLWLWSFVPGLALTYLGHNLQHGDALIGVASLSQVAAASPLLMQPDSPVMQAVHQAAVFSIELEGLQDRTPEEVAQSRGLAQRKQVAEAGAKRVFDCWTAEPLDVPGARGLLGTDGDAMVSGAMSPSVKRIVDKAEKAATEKAFFHWPLAFPSVFDPSSESPGFDVVVGNPPWNEVTIEELGFYALHDPGMRGLPTEQERQERIATLLERFPHLRDELEQRKEELAQLRRFFVPANGYEFQGGGDTDVYQLFCERYTLLCRPGGYLGVVLPRSAFLTAGSRGFRRWLFRTCTLNRIDFLLNRNSWAFPIHPQYTIALMSAVRTSPTQGASFRTTGPSSSPEEYAAARESTGVPIALDDLARWTPAPVGDRSSAPSWEIPLLPFEAAVPVFNKMRTGPRFDRWAAQHGGVFPVRELDETQQKKYFRYATGTPVWKGKSFDQYDPHGGGLAGHASWDEAFGFIQRKRLSGQSTYKGRFPRSVLLDQSTHPIWKARLVFRDVSRSTDSRTVRATIVPPKVFLTNKAPYLVFPNGDVSEQLYVLGIFNSLPFDWQARRFIETNLNFFIVDMLCLPPAKASDADAIVRRAARLACVDDRFAELAEAAGVHPGPLDVEEKNAIRAEIDALVARAYGLASEELEVVFRDFTNQAVPIGYRDLVREKYGNLEVGKR